jgi:hypothetical protein
MDNHPLRLLALAVLGAAALAGPASGQAPATAPYTEPATGLVFPASIGSLVFTGVHDYGNRDDGLDIRYSADGIAATLYVYAAGLDAVPDGFEDPVFGEVLDQVKEDIREVSRQKIYQNLGFGADEIVGLAGQGRGIKARHVVLTYSFDGSSWHSHAFLLGYRGRFIKLRYSYRDEFGPEGEKALLALTQWLSAAMEKQAP